jgi:hypothetical protein
MPLTILVVCCALWISFLICCVALCDCVLKLLGMGGTIATARPARLVCDLTALLPASLLGLSRAVEFGDQPGPPLLSTGIGPLGQSPIPLGQSANRDVSRIAFCTPRQTRLHGKYCLDKDSPLNVRPAGLPN